jgi:hypothetical protein
MNIDRSAMQLTTAPPSKAMASPKYGVESKLRIGQDAKPK